MTKVPGDTIVRQLEVQMETTKEGSVFKKAKSVRAPRVLVVTKHKIYFFDASGKTLKDKRVREGPDPIQPRKEPSFVSRSNLPSLLPLSSASDRFLTPSSSTKTYGSLISLLSNSPKPARYVS